MMRSIYLGTGLVMCLIFLSVVSCDREEEGGSANQLPRIVSITLTPESARPGTTITANVKVSDPEADPVSLEYQWYVDDELMEDAKENTFATDRLEPGTKVFLQVRAVETASGREGEWKKSRVVAMGEVPGLKLAGVTIEPSPLFAHTPAQAVVDYGSLKTYDVERIYYRWLVNLKAMTEDEYAGPELDASYFLRGDRVDVLVCTDGKFDPATTTRSKAALVQNAPPQWTVTPEVSVEGEDAYFRYEAEDPDGDEVNIKVQGTPAGTRAEGPGVLRVDVKSVRPGAYVVTFKASDGHGGEISSQIKLTVPKQQ